MNTNTETHVDPVHQLLALKMAEKAEEVEAMMNPIEISRIENLGREVLDDMMGWAETEGVDKIRQRLKRKGYIVVRSTLARYLRARKQKEASDRRAALEGTAKELVARKDGAAWRVGAMEAIREKLFDEAVSGGAPEERLKLYQTLVGEEERLRKLALEEERARMQRENLELQRERLQIEAMKSGAKFFLEALAVLRDEKIAAELKVQKALAQLERWKGETIEVGEGTVAKLQIEN